MQHETKKPIILHQRYMVNRLWRRFNSNTLCNRGLETNQTKTNSDIHDWCDQCCMRCLLAAVGIPWDSGVGVFLFRTWGLPGQFWSNKNDSVEPLNHVEHCKVCHFHNVDPGFHCVFFDMEALLQRLWTLKEFPFDAFVLLYFSQWWGTLQTSPYKLFTQGRMGTMPSHE